MSLDSAGNIAESPGAEENADSPAIATPNKKLFVTDNKASAPKGSQPSSCSRLALNHGPARELVPFGRVSVEELSFFNVEEFATCVVPRLPWGVQQTLCLCGHTNTCSLDSFLSLIFIAMRNPNGMHIQWQKIGALHEDSLLGKAMAFLEQNQPNEARRLIYEAHPNVKWPEGADFTHNAWFNVGVTEVAICRE